MVERLSRKWLQPWIKQPDRMVAAGDPAVMSMMAKDRNPSMPALKLGDANVAELIGSWATKGSDSGQVSLSQRNVLPTRITTERSALVMRPSSIKLCDSFKLGCGRAGKDYEALQFLRVAAKVD